MKKNIESFFGPIINLLNENNIKYAVIGGIAVLIYGEPRLTEDVDINILLEKDKISDFIQILKNNNISPALNDPVKTAYDSGYLPVIYNQEETTKKYDLIIANNPIEIAAINRSKLIKIDKIEFMVITPEDLIIHKITSQREKDTNDLEGIFLRQKDNIDINYITNWLRKIDSSVKNINLESKLEALLAKFNQPEHLDS